MTPTVPAADTRSAKPPTGATRKRPRRWLRRLWVTGIVLVLLTLFHAPLFRLLAGLLVVDDPAATTDAVIVLGASGPFHAAPFDEAVRLYRERNVREIVLIEDRSSRLVAAGIVPTLESVGRRRLADDGVPERVFSVQVGDLQSDWDAARRLGEWLDAHPGMTATLLCDEFDSRRGYGVCREVLGAQTASRLRWHALADRRYGVSNWWHSRQGVVQFAGACVCLAHAHVFGEPPAPPERWDPDAYERRLKGRAP